MRRYVRRTYWKGPRLVWDATDETGDPVGFRPEESIDWNVGGPQTRRPPHPCAFEPKGLTDPRHRCGLCSRPTSVYLALYGDLPKVGMTAAARIDERLREQGADGGFVISTEPDRAAARRLEQTVSTLFGLPEWRTHEEILPRWAREHDADAIAGLAAQWRRDLARFAPGPWRGVSSVPLPRPLPTVPRLERPAGRHRGRWIGAAGRYVVYERAGGLGATLHALRRSDLEGRWITVGDASPDPPGPA